MISETNLEAQLNCEFSKANVNYICHILGNNEVYYRQLWFIIKRDEYKISSMASWIWEHITLKYSFLFLPYVNEVVQHLPNVKLVGVKRNLLKILSIYQIPIDLQGELFTFCSECLMSQAEPIAIKVYSMQILYNISEVEPLLKPELRDMLEFQFEFSSAGFKSRAQKLLKKLNKEII